MTPTCATCTSARHIPEHHGETVLRCVFKGHGVNPASRCPWYTLGPVVDPMYQEKALG